MGQEHRVVLHVGAAQVENPGDVVHGRHKVVAGTQCLHGRSNLAQLVGAADDRIVSVVFVNAVLRQASAVRPDAFEQIHIGA